MPSPLMPDSSPHGGPERPRPRTPNRRVAIAAWLEVDQDSFDVDIGSGLATPKAVPNTFAAWFVLN